MLDQLVEYAQAMGQATPGSRLRMVETPEMRAAWACVDRRGGPVGPVAEDRSALSGETPAQYPRGVRRPREPPNPGSTEPYESMSEHAVSSEVAVKAAPFERILDASGDLILAALLLITWLAPDASLALPLRVALLTMLLEFIVVHSTGFMGSVALADGPRAERASKVLGLGGFYTLFVGGFALGFGTWWPLIAFWGLTLNRSLGVLFDPHPGHAQRLRIRKSWAAITISYLAAVFLTSFVPMPDFGITSAVVRAAELPASGLWVEQPERVVAAGFLHFFLSGLSALVGHRWISDASIPRQA